MNDERIFGTRLSMNFLRSQTDLEQAVAVRSKSATTTTAEQLPDDIEASDIESSIAAKDVDLEEQERQTLLLVQKETRAVRCLRIAVLLLLLAVTAAVASMTYRYTHNQQVDDFTDTFSNYAQQIQDTVQANAQHKLEAAGALALQIQAYAVAESKTWPYVTLPFFEEHIDATKSLTDAYGVLFFPIVSKENRAEWEAYSVTERGWINESYAAQREIYGEDKSGLDNYDETSFDSDEWFVHLWTEDYIFPGRQPNFTWGFSNKISTSVHDDPEERRPVVDTKEQDYFFPQWQAAPMTAYYQSTVNWNYGRWDDFYNQTEIINRTHTAAFGYAWTDQSTPGYVSTLLYPIYDQFYDKPEKKKEVVAFLSLDIFWDVFLDGILPPNVFGIQVVIENTCDQSFTFDLKGNAAVFLGEGDLHNTEYDDMGVSYLFGHDLMIGENGTVISETYHGTPLDGTMCAYTFNIYPTQEMEDEFVTNGPIVFTVVAVSIFVFTAATFIAYDCIVENRQKKVMKAIKRSEAVVSSLFPAAFKSRLYKEQEELEDRKKKDSEVDEFMGIVNPKKTDGLEEPSPIAELYPATTILFADIAGFTKWSALRQPSEVFLLLETIYGEFDRLAKRRGVFKVETIGDCYVAATGIPRPQEDHALIMTKFARDCLRRMRLILSGLAEQLGPDTMELDMRVGIHSGPVTAGVLRGEKSRFQLFGDTMNTASRMESNGLPHRIHVSEATARLLEQAGKAHWLMARAQLIVAKGKGEMQTYWVATLKESDRSKSCTSTTDQTFSEDTSKSGFDGEDEEDEMDGDLDGAMPTRESIVDLEHRLNNRVSL